MYKRIYDSDEIMVDYYNDGKPMIRISQFMDNHWRDEHFVEGLELVVRGRWKGAGMGDYLCSVCDETVSGNQYRRCPYCGAHMDEEVSE